MAETYTVTDKKSLAYEGYFRSRDLFQVIRHFLKERGYFPLEKHNYEEVLPEGRQIVIELRPFKQISDYLKQVMVLHISLNRVKEEVIEIDGIKSKYSHGKVSFTCDAILRTDLRGKWEGSGWLYLLRTINDKYIRKDWISRSKLEVAKDLDDLLEEVRAFLNMVRFKQDQQTELGEMTGRR